jgi:hypothetical protein
MAWLQSFTEWLAPETVDEDLEPVVERRDLHADLHQRERIYIGAGSKQRVYTQDQAVFHESRI